MHRFLKGMIVLAAVVLLAACTVKTSGEKQAEGTGGTAQPDVENPLVTGGGTEPPPEGGGVQQQGGSQQQGGGTQQPPPPEAAKPVEITTKDLDVWYQGLDHKQKLYGKGGSGQLEWDVTGLPAGLKLQAGRVQGKTDAAGDFPIAITLKDKLDAANTVTKTLSLSVKPFVKEDLALTISQETRFTTCVEGLPCEEAITFSPPLGPNPSVTLSPRSYRLRLDVMKKTDNSPASAPRFYWSVQSPGNKLGIFVAPKETGAQQGASGQTAYLMPWTPSGAGAALRHGLGGSTIKDIVVSVRDDFGNEATVPIASLAFEMTPEQKCVKEGAMELTVEPWPGESFSKAVNVALQNPFYKVKLTAKGGTPPYTWDYETLNEPGNGFDLTIFRGAECDKPDSKTCSYTFRVDEFRLWDVWSDPAEKVKFTVASSSTACGSNDAFQVVDLVAKYPLDKVTDLKAWMDVTDINDTDENSELGFWFSQVGESYPDHTAEFSWKLDQYGDNGKEDGTGIKFVEWPVTKVVAGKTHTYVTDIPSISVYTWDPPCTMCGTLDVRLLNIKFYTKYWYAYWDNAGQGYPFGNEPGTHCLSGISHLLSGGPDKIWMRRADALVKPEPIGTTTNQPLQPKEGETCVLSTEMKKKGYTCVDNKLTGSNACSYDSADKTCACVMKKAEIDAGSQCIDSCVLTKEKLQMYKDKGTELKDVCKSL